MVEVKRMHKNCKDTFYSDVRELFALGAKDSDFFVVRNSRFLSFINIGNIVICVIFAFILGTIV